MEFPIVEWPETPVKKQATTRLDMSALHAIIAAMAGAEQTGVGTFHVPDYDNIKVKLDKESGGHYIVARLL